MSLPRFFCVWISDLHLDRIDSPKNQLFQRVCHWLRQEAENVYILGDLWDAWLGDDSLEEKNWQSGYGACVKALATLAQHRRVFFMVGNRDFLAGNRFYQTCQLQPIDDPYALRLNINRCHHTVLMTHGDRLCLSDTEHMKSFSSIRSPRYIKNFLSKPMSDRIQQLQAYKRHTDHKPLDIDIAETHHWMLQHQAQTIIHGHTHRPAYYPQTDHLWDRWVLHNWDERPGMLAFDQKCFKLYDFIDTAQMIAPFKDSQSIPSNG